MKTWEVAVMSTDTLCEVEDCDRNAVYTVAKEVRGVIGDGPIREKVVCRRCAVEMVELFGWRLA